VVPRIIGLSSPSFAAAKRIRFRFLGSCGIGEMGMFDGDGDTWMLEHGWAKDELTSISTQRDDSSMLNCGERCRHLDSLLQQPSNSRFSNPAIASHAQFRAYNGISSSTPLLRHRAISGARTRSVHFVGQPPMPVPLASSIRQDRIQPITNTNSTLQTIRFDEGCEANGSLHK
jgi:hypothetical protein